MIITPTDLGNQVERRKKKRKKKKENLFQENQLKEIGRKTKHLQIALTIRYHVQGSERADSKMTVQQASTATQENQGSYKTKQKQRISKIQK